MDELLPVDPRRAAMLARIGERWRGDWSGHIFDGRDGQDWIDAAVNGTAADLAELSARLDEIDGMY